MPEQAQQQQTTTLTSTNVSASPQILPDGLKTVSQPLTDHHYTTTNSNDLASADTILRMRIQAELHTAIESGKKLVIIVGENHASPAHIMTEIGLLNFLSEQQKAEPDNPNYSYFVANEIPYNKLDALYGPLANNTDPIDPRLKAYQANQAHSNAWAPISNSLFYNAIIDTNSRLIFDDAVIKPDGQLDLVDPLNNKILLGSPKYMSINGSATSADGLHFRNGVSLATITDKFNETGANILLKRAGAQHVLSDGATGKPEQSLTHLFNEAEYHVLPILLTDKPFNKYEVNNEGLKNWPNTTIIENLGQKTFSTLFEENRDDIMREEATYIQTLIDTHSGPNGAQFKLENYPETEAEAKQAEQTAAQNAGSNHQGLIKPPKAPPPPAVPLP